MSDAEWMELLEDKQQAIELLKSELARARTNPPQPVVKDESDAKDAAQADAACCGIHPGQLWRHYKGGLYYVREVAVKEDTLEILIIYESIAHRSIWARPLSDWVSRVDLETEYVLPDGSRQVGRPRFTPFKDKEQG
jgi:hypothetical protein